MRAPARPTTFPISGVSSRRRGDPILGDRSRRRRLRGRPRRILDQGLPCPSDKGESQSPSTCRRRLRQRHGRPDLLHADHHAPGGLGNVDETEPAIKAAWGFAQGVEHDERPPHLVGYPGRPLEGVGYGGRFPRPSPDGRTTRRRWTGTRAESGDGVGASPSAQPGGHSRRWRGRSRHSSRRWPASLPGTHPDPRRLDVLEAHGACLRGGCRSGARCTKKPPDRDGHGRAARSAGAPERRGRSSGGGGLRRHVGVHAHQVHQCGAPGRAPGSCARRSCRGSPSPGTRPSSRPPPRPRRSRPPRCGRPG